MITTKLYLDKRATIDGRPAPLKIAITKKGSTSYIPLGIYLIPEKEWKNNKVVNHPKRQFYNTYIEKRKLEVDEVVLRMIADKETYGTVTQIKKRIVDKIHPPEEDNSSNLFCRWFDKFVANKTGRTKDIYQATLNRILEFRPNAKSELTFEEMNVGWLTEFDTYLSKNSPARNARNIHFRNIRAVFNYAIDNDATSCYPFRRFKLKYDETRKRSLTVEAFRKIMNAKVEPYQEKYRDFFLLSFYLIGMNVVDLCNATEIVNGRLEYRRAKTHKIYSIKVEPEAMDIINTYSGEGQLLYYLDTHKNYRTFYDCLRKGLHNLTATLNAIDDGVKIPELTTYWARHTWGTIAAELDIPDATISLAMGHSSGGNSTTDIYILRNMKKIDDANRKVIDWVTSNTEI